VYVVGETSREPNYTGLVSCRVVAGALVLADCPKLGSPRGFPGELHELPVGLDVETLLDVRGS
jgi:hypothetical protein